MKFVEYLLITCLVVTIGAGLWLIAAILRVMLASEQVDDD